MRARAAGALALLAAVGAGAANELRRPLIRSVHLQGGSLHGIAMSGSAVGLPFEMPVRVERGSFLWYDRLNEADAMLAKGLLERAVGAYEHVLGMEGLPRKHVAPILLSVARALAAQNRALEARKVLDVALQQAVPDEALEAALLFHSGVLAGMCGELEEAEDAYLEALKLDAGHADALNNLAMVRLLQGRVPEFQESLLAAIKLRAARMKRGREQQQQVLSSFQHENAGADVAAWLVDHAMRVLQVDSSPTLLQAAVAQGSAAPSGYAPGQLEANLVVAVTAFQAGLVLSKARARRTGHYPPMDVELVHYNLGKRLAAAGLGRESARHFGRAAAFGSERACLLSLRARVQREQREQREQQGDEEEQRPEDCGAAQPERAAAICASLGADLMPWEPRAGFSEAVVASCGGWRALAGPTALPLSSCVVPGGALRVGVVAADVSNSTGGELLQLLLRTLEHRGKIETHVFSWPQQAGMAVVNPARVALLGPTAGLDAWRDAVRAKSCDAVLFVDAGLDFRAYLLAHARLASVQVDLRLAQPLDGPVGPGPIWDATVQLAPQAAGEALLRCLWALRRREAAAMRGSNPRRPMIQGQYFFSMHRYYLVSTRASALPATGDAELERVHVRDSQAVLVLLENREGMVGAQRVLRRLEARRGFDLSRVRLLVRPGAVELVDVLRNMDVVLEPAASGDGSGMRLALDALLLRVPVAAGARGSAAARLCAALGLPCGLAPTLEEGLGKRAVELARPGEARDVYLRAVRGVGDAVRPGDVARVARAWGELLRLLLKAQGKGR